MMPAPAELRKNVLKVDPHHKKLIVKVESHAPPSAASVDRIINLLKDHGTITLKLHEAQARYSALNVSLCRANASLNPLLALAIRRATPN